MDVLQKVQSQVKHAKGYNHPLALEAYQTLLNTLDHFTSPNPSLDSKHEAMHARMANLANNAFSCAMRHDDMKMGVELLEQGQGFLWNQLAHFDISMAVLGSQDNQGRELSQKFARLSTGMRMYAQRGEGDVSYWRVTEEWESVVERIRSLNGSSRFLLPPLFEDLQRAAEYGPIIVVDASEYSCDALIVFCTRPPVYVSLPCSLSDVDQVCSQLLELTQDAHTHGTKRESYIKQMLRDQWSSVVEPIVSALQNDVQLPVGSRIRWYPTSKSTILPFHAAGPHRIRSQMVVLDTSTRGNLISFEAAGQGRPSADTKLGELPEVEHKIQRIRNETGMPPEVAFKTVTGDAATIDGAARAFRDHRWVYVACHGSQHAKKPLDSWFAMGDRKLTLMRILQECYMNSEFAFLSACHTAVGDASTPDEVLHLAAGMQFAGFNGVIGTPWKVDDAVAHQVATRFYKELFNHPVIGFEHAAAALSAASEVSLEKRIVFVHIGI